MLLNPKKNNMNTLTSDQEKYVKTIMFFETR